MYAVGTFEELSDHAWHVMHFMKLSDHALHVMHLDVQDLVCCKTSHAHADHWTVQKKIMHVDLQVRALSTYMRVVSAVHCGQLLQQAV